MYNKDIHEGGTVLPPSAHILPLSAPRGAHLQLGAYQEPCHDSNLCILTSQWRTSISGVYFISYYQTSPCYSRDTNDMVSHTSILLSPRSRVGSTFDTEG